jgi:hypothetical protein
MQAISELGIAHLKALMTAPVESIGSAPTPRHWRFRQPPQQLLAAILVQADREGSIPGQAVGDIFDNLGYVVFVCAYGAHTRRKEESCIYGFLVHTVGM